DFLVTYDYPGGSSDPDIHAWRWTGSAWLEFSLSSTDGAAASNAAAIFDPLDGNSSVGARQFGELTLNLLASGLPQNLVACPGFRFVNVRSRSSGESIDSALQDRLPQATVDLSPGRKIVRHKVHHHTPSHPPPSP